MPRPLTSAIGTNPVIKELQQRSFRTWHDSTGSHRQDAALVDYKAGIVHLSSSAGILLEIPESELSGDDQNIFGHRMCTRRRSAR
jgi:hypothetical protein